MSLITSICWLISSNLTKWSSWDLMVLLPEQKWIIKDQEDLRAQEIIRNLCKSLKVLLVKPNQLKILKIIQFRQVPLLWKNLETISNFSSKRKSKRTIIGKVYQWSLQAQAAQEKDSTKLCNLLDPIKLISILKIHTAYMEQMPILLC